MSRIDFRLMLLSSLLLMGLMVACGGNNGITVEVTRAVDDTQNENETVVTSDGDTDPMPSPEASEPAPEAETEPINTEYSGCVWEDTDGDGLKGENESGIREVEIIIWSDAGAGADHIKDLITVDSGCYNAALDIPDPASAVVWVVPKDNYIFTTKNVEGTNGPTDSDVNELGQGDEGETVVWAGLRQPTTLETEDENLVQASSEIWPYIYYNSDESLVDFSTIDLSELESMDINDIEIGYDPETNELFFDVGFNAEDAQEILLGLDFAGEDLQLVPDEPPLVLPGGFNSTFGVAIQNGQPVANIRGIFTGNEMVLTESLVTGAIIDGRGTIRVPLGAVPFGSDIVRGGAGDGSFFAPFRQLDDNGGFEPLVNILPLEALEQIESENRVHVCSPDTNTCIGLRPEWNSDVNGNIISTNIDGAEATWIHGINTETADERWRVILGQGWEDTGPPVTYNGPFSDWFYYLLSSSGIMQGFVGYSETNGFTYELSLQIPSGVTAESSEVLFLETVDTFRGPPSTP